MKWWQKKINWELPGTILGGWRLFKVWHDEVFTGHWMSSQTMSLVMITSWWRMLRKMMILMTVFAMMMLPPPHHSDKIMDNININQLIINESNCLQRLCCARYQTQLVSVISCYEAATWSTTALLLPSVRQSTVHSLL